MKLLCVAELVQALLVGARRRRSGYVVGHAISLWRSKHIWMELIH